MEILKKERDCHYELIRLLACFFVLGVHTMWIIAPDMGIKGLYTRMIDTIFVLCNPKLLGCRQDCLECFLYMYKKSIGFR